MNILKLFIILSAVFLFLPTANCLAEQPAQDEFLHKLESKSEKIQSISSHFTQKSYISLFQDTMESKGKFAFLRPDNLRWEYSSPFVSGFLLKGHEGLKWDEATSKTSAFSTETSPEMAIISEQILAWTTMNISWLNSMYIIKVSQYRPAIMELTPRSAAAKDFLNLIKIFFSMDSSHLKSIELHAPDGDYTKIDFSDVKINERLEKEIFERR